MTAANADTAGQGLAVSDNQPDWALHIRQSITDIQDRQDGSADDAAARAFDWRASAASFPVGDVSRFTEELQADSGADDQAAAVDLDCLNTEQRRVFDHIRDTIASPDKSVCQQMILYGSAGTGKSCVISALRSAVGERRCLVLAPTGVAAYNIRGRTIHSALHVPVGPMAELTSGSRVLEAMQAELAELRLVIIDEFSMVSKAMLAKIDSRLRQAFPAAAKQPFGGVSVLLAGDLYQLKPASGAVLYATGNSSCKWSQNGTLLYSLFSTVFFLDKQVRQAADPAFGRLLQQVRDGQIGESDWQLLMSRRCACADFLSANCVQLYATNAEVDSSNQRRLHQLKSADNPICSILPASSCTPGRGQPIRQQSRALQLIVGARVMLTRNISVRHGLVNGSIGTVKAICYCRDARPPILPDCVFVRFDGYAGPSLTAGGGDEGLVPIVPMAGVEQGEGAQLPLRLAWAVTVHKSQGLTLQEAFVSLRSKSAVQGLVYTALSRVKQLCHLHVSDFYLDRLRKLAAASKLKKDEQDRLRRLSGQ